MSDTNLILTLTLVLMSSVQLAGQTCCSGGVPLSSNLGLPPSQANTLQLKLGYDLNTLRTLKAGNQRLDDDARRRKTHSVLLEAGYSVSDRLAVDGFFSWIRQEREIQQFGNRDFTATNGIGDAVLLFKYKVLAASGNSTVFTTGLGIKFPFGPSGLNRGDGLPINADLQPGSGAWDVVFWNQFTRQLGWRPSMGFAAMLTYVYKGKNTKYLGSQTYQFGNELLMGIGLSDRLFIHKIILDPSLALRFRSVDEDSQNGQSLPNTGGNWAFINPGLSWWIRPELSINANLELPLVAKPAGTQLSPTFRFNAGIYFLPAFSKKNSNLNSIP